MNHDKLNIQMLFNQKLTIGLLISNVALVIAVMLMSIKISQSRERIVFSPLTAGYQLDWNQANQEYFKDMALWITGVIAATNNTNVNNQVKTLDKFMSPQISKQVSEKLRAYSQSIPDGIVVTNWFEPSNVVYEDARNKIFVIGTLYSQTTSVDTKIKSIVYELELYMSGGKPIVSFFDSYEGTTAHTQKYLNEQAQLQKETSTTSETNMN